MNCTIHVVKTSCAVTAQPICSYCTADLHFLFSTCRLLVFCCGADILVHVYHSKTTRSGEVGQHSSFKESLDQIRCLTSVFHVFTNPSPSPATSLHEMCRSVSQNQQNFIPTDKIFYFVRQMSGKNYHIFNDNV